jgi:hypothetical protein
LNMITRPKVVKFVNTKMRDNVERRQKKISVVEKDQLYISKVKDLKGDIQKEFFLQKLVFDKVAELTAEQSREAVADNTLMALSDTL